MRCNTNTTSVEWLTPTYTISSCKCLLIHTHTHTPLPHQQWICQLLIPPNYQTHRTLHHQTSSKRHLPPKGMKLRWDTWETLQETERVQGLHISTKKVHHRVETRPNSVWTVHQQQSIHWIITELEGVSGIWQNLDSLLGLINQISS